MNDKELSVHARRLHNAQSKAAQDRNPPKCECMHEQRVRVETASLGVRNLTLAQHGTVHLSTCKHSDMARTCWERPRKSGRMRARVVIDP